MGPEFDDDVDSEGTDAWLRHLEKGAGAEVEGTFWVAEEEGGKGCLHVDELPTAEASRALEAYLGVGVGGLPRPLFNGTFEADADPTTGRPIGHHLGTPCGWTEYDTQIIHSLGLAVRTVRYT